MKKLHKKPYIPDAQMVGVKHEQDVYKKTLCMGKRKQAKGPNPLSCKKKKVVD